MQLTPVNLPAPSSQARRAATARTVFVRHRWARRYILRVLDDGTLRVTLPRWGSKRDALAFVRGERAVDRTAALKHAGPPAVVHPDEPALAQAGAQ